MIPSVGDRIQLTAAIVGYTGQPADPTDVIFQVKTPNGSESSLVYSLDQVERSGTGGYYIRYLCEQAGVHLWSVNATGTIEAYQQSKFPVRPRAF
jgi:hypothetical protein